MPAAPVAAAERNLDLSYATRTVGGAKVKDVYYAVNIEGEPRGIVGFMWRDHAYRDTRWNDDGTHAHPRCQDWALDLSNVPAYATTPA